MSKNRGREAQPTKMTRSPNGRLAVTRVQISESGAAATGLTREEAAVEADPRRHGAGARNKR